MKVTIGRLLSRRPAEPTVDEMDFFRLLCLFGGVGLRWIADNGVPVDSGNLHALTAYIDAVSHLEAIPGPILNPDHALVAMRLLETECDAYRATLQAVIAFDPGAAGEA